MFSFLKTGDIHNTIRSLTNLPGLFTSDGDKIKYALLNHSTAMRTNLSNGYPIFAGIRQWEAEIERRDINSITSGHLPSMAANAAAASKRSALFNDNDLRIDNAALAFIMAKELAFLNRTIQMISLIASRYQEEQEDLEWGCSPRSGHGDHGDNDNGNDNDDIVSPPGPGGEEDLEQGQGHGEGILQRSHSHDTPDHYCGSIRSGTVKNQLASTFLIASGRLQRRFNGLCALTDTDVVLVNAMTTMDRPHNEANRVKQLTAQSCVISNIFLHFGKFDAEHRDPVVLAFLELRDISINAWRIMSMFAFSNLFRLTEGTDFATRYCPEDAIFTQGRDYRLLSHCEGAVTMRFPTNESTTEQDVPSYD